MTHKVHIVIYKSPETGEIIETPFPDKYPAEVERDDLLATRGIRATIVVEKDATTA